jgi:hypothetical protein
LNTLTSVGCINGIFIAITQVTRITAIFTPRVCGTPIVIFAMKWIKFVITTSIETFVLCTNAYASLTLQRASHLASTGACFPCLERGCESKEKRDANCGIYNNIPFPAGKIRRLLERGGFVVFLDDIDSFVIFLHDLLFLLKAAIYAKFSIYDNMSFASNEDLQFYLVSSTRQ